MNLRIIKDEERGRMIEALIESETNEGSFYLTKLYLGVRKILSEECTCPNFKYRKTCKHLKELKNEIQWKE